jgi:hypothetical protein
MSHFTSPTGLMALTATGAAVGGYFYTNRRFTETLMAVEGVKSGLSELTQYVQKLDPKVMIKLHHNMAEIGNQVMMLARGHHALAAEIEQLKAALHAIQRQVPHEVTSFPASGRMPEMTPISTLLTSAQTQAQVSRLESLAVHHTVLPSSDEDDEVDDIATRAAMRHDVD